MTALGIEFSDRDPEKGWGDTHPTIHPQNYILALALSAWKLSERLADGDDPDWDNIKDIQDIAQDIQDIADEECNCTTRDISCRICNAVARLYNNEEWRRE
jgi:hypothetical protein